MKLSQEKIGELLIFIEIFLYAFSPILIKGSENFLPPLFFAGSSMLIAFIFLFIIIIWQKKITLKLNFDIFKNMFWGAFFLMIIYFPLQFIIGQKITAGNLAILCQSEVLFSFLFFGILKIEKITRDRAIGALLTIVGTSLVLWSNFSGQILAWDLMIIMISVIPSFGNFFQKKTIQSISPTAYLCFRNLLGASLLIPFSLYNEKIPWENIFSQNGLLLIIFSGIISFSLAKILFLEAMKRIDVSKALAISNIMPAISFLFAFLFLNEIPHWGQLIGFLIIFSGILFLTKKIDKIREQGA